MVEDERAMVCGVVPPGRVYVERCYNSKRLVKASLRLAFVSAD